MSLFVCSKCGCIDNTATSYYWFLIRPCIGRVYDESLKGYEGKPHGIGLFKQIIYEVQH